MHSYLLKILEQKKEEVGKLYESGVREVEGQPPNSRRDFKGAISREGSVALIAEIKYASPSAGVIRRDGDTVTIGRTYERAGAAAISLVTDRLFFKGRSADLPILKEAVTLPILRKDFIIDKIQVTESYLLGADAVLLIAATLSRDALETLITFSRSLGMAAITEVHEREELEKAKDCEAEIIGINNRNLKTFEVSIDNTLALAPHVSEGCIIVSESGIQGGEDVSRLKGAGIDAVLVGTGLMKSRYMEQSTRELVQDCNRGAV